MSPSRLYSQEIEEVNVKRLVAHKAEITYLSEIKKNGGNIQVSKYQCSSTCGYIYDPEKGAPKDGINQGIPFEKLPDDWVCPICGAGKNIFKKAE